MDGALGGGIDFFFFSPSAIQTSSNNLEIKDTAGVGMPTDGMQYIAAHFVPLTVSLAEPLFLFGFFFPFPTLPSVHNIDTGVDFLRNHL